MLEVGQKLALLLGLTTGHPRRKAMGEAKRPTNRSDDDGMSGPYLQVSFDHIWPGAAESCFARVDPEHPDRAERCKGALLEVSDEIATGRGKCAECGANIVDLAGLGECSVAHVWNTPRRHRSAFRFAGAALLRRKRCRVWRRWLWRR
jgi:hypothetical protein